MPEENEPRKHITEALSGRAFVPETHEQREERESAENYLEAVASCYNSLQIRERDPEKRTLLEEKRRNCMKLRQKLLRIPSEERQTIIRDYSTLYRNLRKEIDTWES